MIKKAEARDLEKDSIGGRALEEKLEDLAWFIVEK